ncbi:MAG: BON domain-containing protein [Candidatus Competibacteraceae bacterium]|nr:BON domain-containing protein [Candidatus Competibacteraceae bacterium]
MIRRLGCLLLGLGLLMSLNGCVGLLMGGAAAGAIAVGHDRRTTGTIWEDQSIELKTYDALSKDSLLQGRSHINVTSYNTAVLLSGEIATPELSQRAGDIARQIEKVKYVHNELRVGPPSTLSSRSADTAVTTAVKTSLFKVDGIRDFDPTRVKVVTERGEVYLFGLLTPREADAVTNVVRRVNGVQKVVKLFEYIERNS